MIPISEYTLSLRLVLFVAGEISSTVSYIMVPNPTKSIIAETQSRLTDIIRELEKNLSRLVILVGDRGLTASVERLACYNQNTVY